MGSELSCSVSMHEEYLEGKKVFVADCVELGISDFGENIDEALNNLRNAVRLLLEEAPEKTDLLRKNAPVFVTRLPL